MRACHTAPTTNANASSYSMQMPCLFFFARVIKQIFILVDVLGEKFGKIIKLVKIIKSVKKKCLKIVLEKINYFL